jgi:glycosyltransferase involved in cell wall biosynthesis
VTQATQSPRRPEGPCVLFVHQDFPGPLRHAARQWAGRPGWQLRAVCDEAARGMPEVAMLRYRVHGVEPPDGPRTMEMALLRGQAVARALTQFKTQGFEPDVIVAHPGWGETLCVKDVFPRARLIHCCDWYWRTEACMVDFDPEFAVTTEDVARMRTWNALRGLNLEHCDAGLTPTHWQHGQFPQAYRDKIAVGHLGIDPGRFGPDPAAVFELPVGPYAGTTLGQGARVITYIAGNLEPHRGFHQFMRALRRVQMRHKTCQTVIVGGDDLSYGRKPAGARNWRTRLLTQVRVDHERTHFVGRLPEEQIVKLLQVSGAHVHLSYPYTLGDSLLEALACGCNVIGSNTSPVTEVMRHGANGRLVDFFEPIDIANAIVEVLGHPHRHAAIRQRAIEGVKKRYSAELGLRLLERLAFPDGGFDGLLPRR